MEVGDEVEVAKETVREEMVMVKEETVVVVSATEEFGDHLREPLEVVEAMEMVEVERVEKVEEVVVRLLILYV